MLDAAISFYADFFQLLVSFLGSYGLAILSLSVLSALAMLKLTKRAEQSVRTEQEYQKVFSPQIDRLKQELSGDAYHKALRQLYKRYSYHPIFAIRQVFPLLIQLPFLILTYLMLSERPELVGQSFLGIQDLSKPDALIAGGNFLPLLMTVLNIATAFLLPGVQRKERLQAVAISLLFLIVLYDANAGILLYWTFNNLIQLGKALSRYFTKGKEEETPPLLGGIQLRHYLPDTLLLLALIFLFLSFQAYLELLAIEDTPRTHVKIALIYLVIFSGFSVLGVVFKSFQPRAVSICLIGALFITIISTVTLLLISPYELINAIAGFVFYYKLVPLYLFPPIVMGSLSFAFFILVKKQNNLERNAYFTVSIGASIAALSFHWLNNSVFLFAQTVPLYFLTGLAFAVYLALISYPFIRAIKWPAASWEVLVGALLFAIIMLPTLHAILIWSSYYLEYTLLIALSYSLFSYLYRQGRRIVYSFFALFTLINISLLVGHNFLGKEKAFLETKTAEVTNTQEIQKRIDFFTKTKQPIIDRPNIYFLVSESMPDLATLRNLGIDVLPLKNLLDEYNFKTYEDTYTIGPMSLPSMSRTLDIRTQISDGDEMRKIVGGHSISNIWLQSIGYQSAIVTKAFMTGIYNAYDIRKPDMSVTAGKMDFLLMLLRGVALREFKFDIKGLKSHGKDVDYEAIKHELIKAERQDPLFMIYHGDYPGHSQNSGQCLPDEKERFIQRYYKAIKLLRADLKIIKEHDPNAIIVIMGDHGPYLTGNCHTLNYKVPDKVTELDLRDRIGTIFSVYWPDPVKAAKYDRDIVINQDFFPVLFSYLYDSPDLLSLKVPSRITLGGRSIDNGKFE